MNAWNAGAVIAAIIALIGAGTSWGQNVRTNDDQDRRIGVLEQQARDVQGIAVQQARIATTVENQTKSIDNLTKVIQDLGRKLERN